MAFTPAGGPQTLHKGPKDEEGVCGGGERERERYCLGSVLQD